MSAVDLGDPDDEPLLAVKSEIEAMLISPSRGEAASVQAEDAYEGGGNICGVGIGVCEDGEDIDVEPGASVLNIYTVEPMRAADAKAVVASSMGVQALADNDIPVRTVCTGEIDADSHRFKMRPAPGGISVGHVRVTAGTLGCLARGRRAPRNQRVLMLSNNHVIANSNNARFGDSIIQPGRADGGRSPRDQIAILERFVPIRFGGPANFVDSATGWCWSDRVRRELVYLRGGQRRLFRVSSTPVACRRNMLVGKSGRTTQLTVDG